MSDTPVTEKPAVAALLGDLASDAKGFARAEAAYFRAQLGERTAYAKPALAMIGIGAGLIIGVAIAVPIGLVLALSPLVGTFASLAIVTIAGTALGALLLIWGTKRIKAAVKPPEQR
jgi:hypothetical protein